MATKPDSSARPESKHQRGRFSDAVKTAEHFARAFARPSSSGEKGWWKHVKPLMAPRYRADYSGVDPARVGYSKVTGSAHVVPTAAPADVLTAVLVPTNNGRYLVELERNPTGLWVTAISRWRGRP